MAVVSVWPDVFIFTFDRFCIIGDLEPYPFMWIGTRFVFIKCDVFVALFIELKNIESKTCFVPDGASVPTSLSVINDVGIDFFTIISLVPFPFMWLGTEIGSWWVTFS